MGERLKGRLAVITGASRGVGAAIAKAYAGEGAHVILVSRNSSALEELDDQIKLKGCQTFCRISLIYLGGSSRRSRITFDC